MSAAASRGGKEQGCDLVAAAGSRRSAGEASELVRVFDSQEGDYERLQHDSSCSGSTPPLKPPARGSCLAQSQVCARPSSLLTDLCTSPLS